jgi:hypothetical protein
MTSFFRHRYSIAISAVSVLILVGLMGCGGSGGGSGSDSTPPENSSPLVVASVQFGLPVSLSFDDGEINGAVFPSDKADAFVTVDPSDPTGKMGIWLKLNVSGAQVMHYDWEIVDWQSQGSSGELSYYDQIVDIDPDLSVYKVRSTNDYLRYDCAINSAISSNHVELVKVTAWTEDGYFTSAYFKLNIISNRRLFVVGDSVSSPFVWPKDLALLSGRHTFSQAIGGTRSPSMVDRASGVELSYPVSGVHQIDPGIVQVRWHRHIADRTHSESYRSKWPFYTKAVSEPEAIEVYQGGDFVGYANRVLKPFSTNYSGDQKSIYCIDHGMEEGDRIALISNDSNWPSDLSVLDPVPTWFSSSTLLPNSIVERRVYFIANVTTNSFELKELEEDAETVDLGSDSLGNNFIECGWRCDVHYSGSWDLSWRVRTKYNDLIWLLEVSANDIPVYSASSVTIPNTEKLLGMMDEGNSRFVLVCPPSGSYANRGPESFNWGNYYDTFMPWVYTSYPDNHIDTMSILGAMRTQTELNLLTNPNVPELLWISGDPMDESTWTASTEAFGGATQMWVGPGYIPLQFRRSFADGIHFNSQGNQILADAIFAFINEKGW